MPIKCSSCGKCCSNIFIPFLANEDEKRWIEYHSMEVIENEIGTFIKIILVLNLKTINVLSMKIDPKFVEDILAIIIL
jgi:Fe-S-cluster containining protein